MNEIGRNAPCPCGSGKRYKNCCLRGEERGRTRQGRRALAFGAALDWLRERHGDDVGAAIEEGFFGACDDDERERLDQLPDDLAESLWNNVAEWLLADGWLESDVGEDEPEPSVASVLLGPDGPRLTSAERAQLKELAARPLRLYEVLESRPGEGFRLRDLLAPEGSLIEVVEHTASRALVQWDVFGARVITEGAAQVLSGAFYPIAGDRVLPLLDVLREALGPDTGEPVSEIEAADARDLVAGIIIDEWLMSLAQPSRVPELRDAGTQEQLMLITDHFEVLDWERLAGALAGEPDVEGSREEGWVRFQSTADGEDRHSILAINLGTQANRLEPFARTQRLADEGRAWLERVAGGALRFLARDSVDPRTMLEREHERGAHQGRPAREATTRGEAFTPTVEQLQQIHEHIYRKWADEPVPLLGDRTPREALDTAEGRAQVIRLLKSYEAGEARMARAESRTPVDFTFLWEQVGLDREEAVR